MTKRENRKIMVALLLATIMIIGGFMGLMYFNHENNTVDKTQIPELNYYLNKYDLWSSDSAYERRSRYGL